MNKLFSITIIALMLSIALVAAKPAAERRVGSIDDECNEAGFEFGIVKYEWTGDGFVAEDDALEPWDITLEGYDLHVEWTANPAVTAVLSKEATETFTHDGGIAGDIEPSGQHAISHITFCGGDVPEAPEFGSIAAIALIVGIFGLVLYKRP